MKTSLSNPIPLKHTCLPEMVEKELIKYIKREKVQSGQVLPSEKQLSEYFGVGRASIREGVARLKNAGLVKSVQGLGIVLNDVSLDKYFQSMIGSKLGQFINMTDEEIGQLIEIRTLLEQDACLKYIQHGVESDLEGIFHCLEVLRKDAQIKDEENFRIHDLDFHKAIVHLGKNKVADYFYSIIRIPSLREIEMLFSHENFDQIQNWHEEIYKALLNKDSVVTELIVEHLSYSFDSSEYIIFNAKKS